MTPALLAKPAAITTSAKFSLLWMPVLLVAKIAKPRLATRAKLSSWIPVFFLSLARFSPFRWSNCNLNPTPAIPALTGSRASSLRNLLPGFDMRRSLRVLRFLLEAWTLPFLLGFVASSFSLVYQLNTLDTAYADVLAQQFQQAAAACGVPNGN